MLNKIYYWFHRLSSKPQERGEYSSGVWQDRIRRESLKLCRYSKGRIIEIGCGEGLFLNELALHNKDSQIYGIDNCKDRLDKASRNLRDKNIKNACLFKANALYLPFKNNYFDCVICINVIFNLESLTMVKNVLNEISRICKKDGRVILDFRNKENPFLYLKYKFAPLYDQTVRNLPLMTYRLEDMRLFLEEAGLKIVSQISIGFPIKIAPVIILETQKL